MSAEMQNFVSKRHNFRVASAGSCCARLQNNIVVEKNSKSELIERNGGESKEERATRRKGIEADSFARFAPFSSPWLRTFSDTQP